MPESRTAGFAAYVAPAIAYCAFIIVMSHLPSPPTPTFNLDWGDKVTHAGAYGLMMLFATRATAWLLPDRTLRGRLIAAVLYCTLFGITDELHQALVPNRQCDVFDWMADTVGALLAAAVVALVIRSRIGAALFTVAKPATATTRR